MFQANPKATTQLYGTHKHFWVNKDHLQLNKFKFAAFKTSKTFGTSIATGFVSIYATDSNYRELKLIDLW